MEEKDLTDIYYKLDEIKELLEDKKKSHNQGKCYDCGLPYSDFVDLSVPDHIWDRINPTMHKEGGLLCPNCMGKRIRALDDISEVHATIYGVE